MDQRDRQILDLLQHNNRLTYDEIAAAVDLSPTAVQRRIKKYRDSKLITSDVSVVDPVAAGFGLTVIVELTMAKGPGYPLEEFKKSVQPVAEITQCYHVTGKSDFLMVIQARDVADYEAFTRRFFNDNPLVARFDTAVVLNRIKANLSVPILHD